jgi:hypothetical protein
MARQFDLVARRGHLSRSVAEQSRERGHRFIGPISELDSQQLFYVSKRQAAAHD